MLSARRMFSCFSLAALALAAGCSIDPEGEPGSLDSSETTGVTSSALNQAEVLARVTAEARAKNLTPPTSLTSVQGPIGYVTVESGPAGASKTAMRFTVRTASGTTQSVELAPSLIAGVGGLAKVTASRVAVQGYLAPGRNVLIASHLTIIAALTPVSFTGTKRWLTIPCRFSDLPAGANDTREFFQGLMGAELPGQADYWSKASLGRLQLDGQTIMDWQDMPEPASFYQEQDESVRWNVIAQACFRSADLSIDLSQFDGFSMVLSHDRDLTKVVAGRQPLLFDGSEKQVHFSVSVPATYRDHMRFTRNVGASFGLHLSGSTPQKHDSNWDVMSAGGVKKTPTPAFGFPSVFPSADHLGQLGILSPSEVHYASSGTTTVKLDYVGTPVQAGHKGLVRIPVGTNRYYTLEARKAAPGTYDANVPYTGVVVQSRNTVGLPADGGSSEAIDAAATSLTVVDMNKNGDPNDLRSALTVQAPDANGAYPKLFVAPETLPVGDAGRENVRVTVTGQSDYGYDLKIERSAILKVSAGAGGTISGPGILCGQGKTQCTATFDLDKVVSLQITPAAGKKVKSKSGCTPGTAGSCKVTMAGGQSVTASFEDVPPKEPCTCTGPAYKCEQLCGAQQEGEN